MHVAALYVHPLKSAAPVQVETMALDEWGAVNDRRWMLIDDRRMAITQREVPALALIRAHPGSVHGTLTLHAPGLPPFDASISHREVKPVEIWKDMVDAHDAGDDAAQWCSRAIGQSCRLVYLHRDSVRPLDPKYAGALNPTSRRVAFSDGAPLLLLGQSAIDVLNERLLEQGKGALGVERFRPNILISGVMPAHDEDEWLEILVGSVRVGVGSLCPRCVLTTVDQQRGERDGPEPLRTLATYRRIDGQAMFGVNATHASVGEIRTGDVVTVVRRK